MASLPLTYAMIFPMVIWDICIEIYHRVCFPLCGITLLKRSNYIRFDRHKLSYLTIWEKIGCTYCSYANGLMNYSAAIAGESEKYWCGIMQKKYEGFVAPPHHKDFKLEYGDEKAYRELTKKPPSIKEGGN